LALSFGFGAPFAQPGPTGASVSYQQLDVLGVNITTHDGQTYLARDCFFSRPCPTFTAFSAVMRGLSPATAPLEGDPTTVTVDGTFGISLGAVVFFLPPFQPPLFLNGSISGPASLTFAWSPFLDEWRFQSGEGAVVTPEPPTLLRLATTGAGLGIARWHRRRARERTHAA
jgi:hypothetical protein